MSSPPPFLPVRLFLLAACLTLSASAAWSAEPAAEIRAGIIGLDTSHVIAFTRMINDPSAAEAMAGVTVVAAYPGGSEDLPASRDRIEGFTNQVREMGVEIVDSIDALLEKVDVVLLESVDGRKHLEQVRPVLAAGKPVYIDKPVAASLADAVEIFHLAEKHGVPCFSSSSLRFAPGIIGMRTDPPVGEIRGCDAYSPCAIEPTHPDLFWYGVHGVEILFTIMGTGIESVTRVHTEGTDVVVGVWKDGRVGTYRGIRDGRSDFGATVFGTTGIAPAGPYTGYGPLVEEICRFFQTGEAPVSAEETIEIFAFMEAAEKSKDLGGSAVSIADVLEKARPADPQ